MTIEKSLAMSVPEAAKLLGISRLKAYEYCRRGELPSIRLGGRVLVPRQALERLLASANKPAAS